MAKTLKTWWEWLVAHEVEARQAVRMAAAGVGSYALALALNLPQGYWAVFSAIIVTQASLGGSVKATIDRLTGTLGGAVIGGIAAAFVIHDTGIAVGIALAVALLPLGFLAAVDGRFRVAPVTAAIVLVSPFGQEASPLWFTLDRILEIGLGSVVALAVSIVVLPGRAHAFLTDSTARLLSLMAEFFALIVSGATQTTDGTELRRLQVATRRTLAALDAAADEAKRERAVYLTDAPDPDPVARTALRIRNDMILIARATVEPLPAPFAERLGPALSAIQKAGGDLLRDLGRAFETHGEPPSLEPLDSTLRAYRDEVAKLRAEGATRGVDATVLGRFFSLGYALEQFRHDVGDMADRARDLADSPLTPPATTPASQ